MKRNVRLSACLSAKEHGSVCDKVCVCFCLSVVLSVKEHESVVLSEDQMNSDVL